MSGVGSREIAFECNGAWKVFVLWCRERCRSCSGVWFWRPSVCAVCVLICLSFVHILCVFFLGVATVLAWDYFVGQGVSFFFVAACGSLWHMLFKLCLKLVFLCYFLYLFPSLLAISILVMGCR